MRGSECVFCVWYSVCFVFSIECGRLRGRVCFVCGIVCGSVRGRVCVLCVV